MRSGGGYYQDMIVLLVIGLIFWAVAIPLGWAWSRAAKKSEDGPEEAKALAGQYYWATTACFFFGLFAFAVALLIGG